MRRALWGLVLVAVLAVAYSEALSPKQEKPVILEAFGDSLTTGFFSDSTLTDGVTLPRVERAYADLLATRGLRSGLSRMASAKLAWPRHLGDRYSLTVRNFAVTNARAKSLLEQVDAAGSPKAPTLAFLFAGHNELCELSAEPTDKVVDDFRSHVLAALATWERSHSGSTMHLLPVGDIGRVYTTLWNHTWNRDGRGEHRCSDTYQTHLPVCPALARMQARGTLAAYSAERTQRMNQVLKVLAAQHGTTGSSNRVVYVEKLEKPELEPEYFALDCLHLSELGQKALADAIADAIPFGAPPRR